jgi:hypothetical protein
MVFSSFGSLSMSKGKLMEMENIIGLKSTMSPDLQPAGEQAYEF